jgi:hypothetical protein
MKKNKNIYLAIKLKEQLLKTNCALLSEENSFAITELIDDTESGEEEGGGGGRDLKGVNNRDFAGANHEITFLFSSCFSDSVTT